MITATDSHPAQPIGPVLRYLGFALAVVPVCGVALLWVIGLTVMPDDPSNATLIGIAAPIVCVGLGVVGIAGVRREYPWWLTTGALLGVLVTAVPWLFVVSFSVIAVACTQFNELCLG